MYLPSTADCEITCSLLTSKAVPVSYCILPAGKVVCPLWLAQPLQGGFEWHSSNQSIALYIADVFLGTLSPGYTVRVLCEARGDASYVESDIPARKGIGPLRLAQRLQGEVQWHRGDQSIILYLLPILQGGSLGFLVQPDHSIVTSILLQHRSQCCFLMPFARHSHE